MNGEAVTLKVNRDGETLPVSVTPAKDASGIYKLGLWVRDDTQGIGTLTYVNGNGSYGALGHGISDIDTADLLEISGGALHKAQVLAVIKAAKEIRGNWQDTRKVGILQKITKTAFTDSFIQMKKTSGENAGIRKCALEMDPGVCG